MFLLYNDVVDEHVSVDYKTCVLSQNVWQAQNVDKRENVGTCRTRQHLPSTFVRTHQIHCHLPNHIARAHQTCPHSPSRFARTRQTRLHSQNAIFEKMCLSLLNSSEY
jgi:rRNA maturation endonuclease Nob1